ncbi:MAG: IMPACT family protein [Parahaliea sp.]
MLIPTAPCETEYIVKKSRFIARLLPVQSRDEVNEALAQAQRDYPDARHHCWAYLLGEPADARSAGMNDAGEPAGTAGKPILNVLQHGHLGDVLVIVIRYFGGIKLGAGGLIRAYGTAAQQVLDIAVGKPLQVLEQFVASGDFACEQVLRHWLAENEGQPCGISYNDGVDLQLQIPQTKVDAFREFCAARRIDVQRR